MKITYSSLQRWGCFNTWLPCEALVPSKSPSSSFCDLFARPGLIDIYIYILILILVILIHSLEWRKDLSCRAVDPSKLASIPWWSPVTTLCHIIEQQLQIKSSYMSCLMIICLNTSNLQKDQKSFSPIFP